MKKLLKTLALVAIFAVAFYAVGAWAQSSGSGSDGVESVVSKLASTFEDVKKVFFVLAAFGIIGLAAAALLGKIQWKWLWALIFGVAIVAAAGTIVKYAAGDNANTTDAIIDTSLE